MTNLLTTVPVAFDYLLSMITTAAASADIYVADSQLGTYEPGTYIELTDIANHRYEIDALGAYAFLENYDLQGVIRVFRGDTDMQQARLDAFDAYSNYVIIPLIGDKRLGNNVMWAVPSEAEATNETTNSGGRQCVITFSISVESRLTV